MTTPLVLDANAIAGYMPKLDVYAALRDMFRDLGNGAAVQSPQTLTLFPQDAGDFITYMGAIDGSKSFGAKLSPYIVTGGAPVITAWTLLMSMETGQPLALMDAGQLTVERTAGTTALAVDLLAPAPAKRLAIIGSGAIAQAHWRYVQGLRDWSEIRIWSPSLAGNAETRAAWQALCPAIHFADSAEDALTGADVTMLCTSSGTPVVAEEALSGDMLVTSISTNVARAHEVPPGFLTRAQVYCDYRATTPAAAGEMQLAAEQHGWQADALRGDLPELVTGKCPKPEPGTPVFFRSIGLGLEDLAIAQAVYAAASA